MSRRMGRPKALLPLGGVPLLARVVRTIGSVNAIDPIVVVTGHLPDQIDELLGDFNVERVHNPDYAAGGMISSVKAAMHAIAERCDAFFLVLGDQPLVRASTYQALLDAWTTSLPLPVPRERAGERVLPALAGEGESLKAVRSFDLLTEIPKTKRTLSPPLSLSTWRGSVSPVNFGRRGHPILFPASAIDDILALSAGATLKDYTHRHPSSEIAVDDPAILDDIDTPQDYDRAVQILSAHRSEPCINVQIMIQEARIQRA